MADKIKVMIVNGSAVMRQQLAKTLIGAGGIEVIATAPDPLFALEKMRTRWPDVLISDAGMPRLDDASFIKPLMAQRPTPVIVCSSQPATGAPAETLAADDIVRAVRRAAAKAGRIPATRVVAPRLSADAVLSADLAAAHPPGGEQLVAIGTSTGGTNALEAILTRLPLNSLGIVIVQHMPAVFTAMFAERLDAVAQIEVREARNGDHVRPGRALIAPGGKHMMLRRNGAQYRVEVVDGPLVNRHRPSVDVLFRSVAQLAGPNALGIIMTGMGDDGARGLKEMHDAGARTIAQDEASCVVFGMPNEAIKRGAVDLTLPLDGIAPAIVNYSKGNR